MTFDKFLWLRTDRIKTRRKTFISNFLLFFILILHIKAIRGWDLIHFIKKIHIFGSCPEFLLYKKKNLYDEHVHLWNENLFQKPCKLIKQYFLLRKSFLSDQWKFVNIDSINLPSFNCVELSPFVFFIFFFKKIFLKWQPFFSYS